MRNPATTPRRQDPQAAQFRRLSGMEFHRPTPSWSRATEAWFLGPKGENADVFEKFLLEAFRDHVFWRRNFHPGDPSHITDEVKRSPEYLKAMDDLHEQFWTMLAMLKKSVPFFSMRYQGHMNWETTMPGVLGSFAAMLYNPNNVAFEASTATTLMEIVVGDELCAMLGYPVNHDTVIQPGTIRPWGHITADGTVANIEAMWMARNLKLFPLALQAALQNDQALAAARDITVSLPAGGSVKLAEADAWQVLNLKADDVLALPARLQEEFRISRDALSEAINTYSVQTLGMAEFARRFLGDIGASPAMFVTGTKHYSWPKAAAVLGIGEANLFNIPVDADGRMDVAVLEQMLEQALAERRPVYSVVVVVGSTEESAVDPVVDVLALRERFRARGLEFPIHADAAWGGYFTSIIRDDFDVSGTEAAPNGQEHSDGHLVNVMSPYTRDQLAALGRVDSITVDPHKSGYIPYPAGALCYRNSAMRDLVTFAAPVVFHGEAEPSVGVYGIEGSKPGAAPAAVYLSHQVIRPSESGYGRLLGQVMFTAARLYIRLLTMFGPNDRFVVVPVARPPKWMMEGDYAEHLRFLEERIDCRSNDEVLNDPEALQALEGLGPDLNIVSYAFNFRNPDGKINTDLELANRLNQAIYDRLSINPNEDIYGYDLIVSTTVLNTDDYGERFIEDFKSRLGVAGSPGRQVRILRSVVMDPWISDAAHGGFMDTLEQVYRRTVSEAFEGIHPTQTRGY